MPSLLDLILELGDFGPNAFDDVNRRLSESANGGASRSWGPSSELDALPDADFAASELSRLVSEGEARRAARLGEQMAALKNASSPDSLMFTAQGNDVFRGDGSKMDKPRAGSFSKTKFKGSEDYAVADMVKEGIPEPMARLLFQNRPKQSDIFSPQEARQLRSEGFGPDVMDILARSRAAQGERRQDAAKAELSLMGNRATPEQEDTALMQMAMTSKDPRAAMSFVRAILKRRGRPDDYINALFGIKPE